MLPLSSITVIIPVYGRLFSLRDAIESVFLQRLKPLEIIVIDDGSDTLISDYLQNYTSRVQIIRHSKNLGVSVARNTGIINATGDYIAFLDSDDLWLPDKLYIQYNNMISNGSLISHTNEFWNKDGTWLNRGKKHIRYGGMIFNNILDFCRVSPSTLMIRKDIFQHIGLFKSSLRVCEDYEFILRASLKYNIDYYEKYLTIKRSFTGDQLSKSIQYIESIRLEILKTFLEENNDLEESYKNALILEIQRKSNIVKYVS